MKRTLVIVMLTLCASIASAATVTKWLRGVTKTALSTELDNVTNTNYATLGGVVNNIIGGAEGDGYVFCDVEGFFTFGGNPTATGDITLWFLRSVDGTTYEDTPSSTVTLGRPPDVVLPVTAGQVSTRVVRTRLCPTGLFKVRAKNNGTGQTLAGSGNTVKIYFFTPEGI